MVFAASLVCQVLLATAAFAIPSSRERLAARVAARASRLSNTRQVADLSGLTNVSHAESSSNWAGGVLESSANTFKSVTGTFVVPTPTGSGAASAWVGIDGDTCQTAILQTGIDFTISGGRVSYDAWFEFFPAFATDFTGITVSAGNSIRLTVTASSLRAGTAKIENLTTGVTVSRAITSTSSLCESNAEWIVEDFEENGSMVPLANFGTVTFTNAVATTGTGASVTPAGAVVINMVQGSTVATASVSSSGVTVRHA
ncbi:aspergillopepsin [Mycena floridula]|nr:aspergillopepsin [Mycena floridula]KAJ7575848.1 aspergillopepsin [Mycena floridula]